MTRCLALMLHTHEQCNNATFSPFLTTVLNKVRYYQTMIFFSEGSCIMDKLSGQITYDRLRAALKDSSTLVNIAIF